MRVAAESREPDETSSHPPGLVADSGGPVIHSMTNRRKGITFYVLTLTMALSVALLGPDSNGQLQILNMLTPTIAVLAMLLVLTPDGYRRAGWAGLALHRPDGAAGRWRCSCQWLSSARRTAPPG